MPEPIVDISVLGDKALERALGSFEPKVQKKVMRQVIRASTKRNKVHVASAWQQHADEGVMAAAMKTVKVRAGKRSRSSIRMEWPLPIGWRDGYPLGLIHNAVEYGHARAPAKAYTRRTVNSHTREEHAEMARHTGRGIEREALKHFKKAVSTA